MNTNTSLILDNADSVLSEINKIKNQWNLVLQDLPSDEQWKIKANLESTYALLDALKEKITRLDSLNNYDALTGTFHREFCNKFLTKLKPSPDSPVTIVAGDVNNLKLTNDVFGHAAAIIF